MSLELQNMTDHQKLLAIVGELITFDRSELDEFEIKALLEKFGILYEKEATEADIDEFESGGIIYKLTELGKKAQAARLEVKT